MAGVTEHSAAAGPARGPLGRWSDATLISLTSRNYRLLFQGSFAIQIGLWMQQVVFGWLVLELTDSPFYLGLTGFFRALPMLLVSPFGGVLADRIERRQLLVASQGSMMAVTTVLATMVWLRIVEPWHLLVASFLMGTAMSMNMPARQALVGELVTREQLPSAVALNMISMNTSRIVGPALAGALIGVVGIAGCLFLQATGYIWSIGNVLATRIPPREAHARANSILANLLEGFRYCYEEKRVFGLLTIVTLVSVAGMPYMQFLPALARDTLGLGPEGLGMLFTGIGVGALTGSLAVSGLGSSPRRGVIQLVAALVFGLGLVGCALARNLALELALLAIVGASSAILMALNQTVLQQVVPDRLRGRVMSVYMVTWGLMPLGTLPLGIIAEARGTPDAILLGGAVCAAAALWMLLFRPSFRRI